MQIPLGGDYLISIMVTKGRYSSCLNPHILFCKRHAWGWGLRFPRHWRVWNLEWSWRKRRNQRRFRRQVLMHQNGIIKLADWYIGRRNVFSLFKLSNGTIRLYYRLPFARLTQRKEWK
mgnify:FL=1